MSLFFKISFANKNSVALTKKTFSSSIFLSTENAESNTSEQSTQAAPTQNKDSFEYLESEYNRIHAEYSHLNRVHVDINDMRAIAVSNCRSIKEDFNSTFNSCMSNGSISQETHDKIDLIKERNNRLMQSGHEKLQDLDHNQGKDSVDVTHIHRAMLQLELSTYEKYIDATLDEDTRLSRVNLVSLNEIRTRVEQSRIECTRLSDFETELMNHYKDKDEQEDELGELDYGKRQSNSAPTETDRPENTSSSGENVPSEENRPSERGSSSLVDDFADTSTEMPSYMDPED